MDNKSGLFIRNVYRLLMEEEKKDDNSVKPNIEFLDKIQESVFKTRCYFHYKFNPPHSQNS